MPMDCRICCAHADFFGAVAAGRGRQRHADGVANAFLQQHAQRRARSDDALGAHAGLGESKMQRIVAPRRERTVDVDQVLHPTNFRAKNNLIRTQAVFLGKLGRVERADDHGFHGNFAGVLWLGEAGVLVHHASQQGLIERSPVDADAHRLLILHRNFDHGGEVRIILAADADVAGIDPILSQGPCTLRKLLKQEMAIVMKVADDGDGDALLG